MSRTFLNGKLTVSSLAVPTEDDVAAIRNLSDADYRQFRNEALDRAANSGISNKTVDEIFESAIKKARQIQLEQEHVL